MLNFEKTREGGIKQYLQTDTQPTKKVVNRVSVSYLNTVKPVHYGFDNKYHIRTSNTQTVHIS